jgi:transposase
MTLPSFRSGPVPRDTAPRRYKDAPTTIGPGGYVLEWCPTHPRASHGVYFQHRLVIEEKLGRFLSKQERVDHDDRNRVNNDPDNLILHATQSAHMRAHWAGKGKNDPELIERVRRAAADPTIGLHNLGIGATTIQTICREHAIAWVPSGQRGHARLLTDDQVKAALQGRSTVQAAQMLNVSVATLYNRFDYLLTKRPKPNVLDPHRAAILRLAHKERLTKAEIGRRYGVSDVCAIRSIQRWSRQDAKSDASAVRSGRRTHPSPLP